MGPVGEDPGPVQGPGTAGRDFPACSRAWEALGRRSRAFLESVPVDLAKDDFTEILLLLKHSLDAWVSSQALLVEHARFEGLVPLSRSLFEIFVQLKYLARHPEALRHYALFERLKAAEHQRRLLESHRERVEAGEAPLLDPAQEAEALRRAGREEARAASFASLGVARRKVKDRSGKARAARTWYENYKGIAHLAGLAEAAGEGRLYARFYPAWSASQHGQTVSLDYALRLEAGRFATKASAAFEAEARDLFGLSVLAGALGHLLLVRRFRPEDYPAERGAVAELLVPLGLGGQLEARSAALEAWI